MDVVTQTSSFQLMREQIVQTQTQTLSKPTEQMVNQSLSVNSDFHRF